jgi:hypothetical protein
MTARPPSPSFQLGPRPERLQPKSSPTKVIFCCAAQLLQLHRIIPKDADIIELGRLRFFNVCINGEIILFATTPIEEMLVDHWKELREENKPDLASFVRLGSGQGVVKQFPNMRTSDYLVQTFTMDKVSIHQ